MKTPRRHMPSPALVVAIAALVAALAGSAAAEVATTAKLDKKSKKQVRKISKKEVNKQFPIESEQISDGAVETSKIADDAVTNSKLSNPTYSALVQANGNFVRGVGATTSQRINAGNYRVEFETDISQCTYQATPANVNQSLTAHADVDAVNNQRVFVSLRNAANATRTDGNFQVAVFC